MTKCMTKNMTMQIIYPSQSPILLKNSLNTSPVEHSPFSDKNFLTIDRWLVTIFSCLEGYRFECLFESEGSFPIAVFLILGIQRLHVA